MKKPQNTLSPLSDSATLLLSETVTTAFSKSESDQVYEWIAHKHRHTIGVLHAYRRIVEFSGIKMSPETFDRGEAACLLHDLGRFYEHNGKNVFGHGQFQHGKYGAAIASKEEIYPACVILSIRYHDARSIDGIFNDPDYIGLSVEEQDEAQILLGLTRDADKFENMEYGFSKFGGLKMFGIGGNLSDSSGYSEKALAIFGDKSVQGTLPRELVNTAADKKLSMISWLSDFAFQESVAVFPDRFFEKVFESLMESAQTDGERRLIKAGVKKYLHLATKLTTS